MLIVVFQRQGVLRAHDPIDIGNHLMRQEVCRACRKSVFRKIDGWNETVGRRDQKLAIGHFVVEQAVGDGTDVAGSRADRWIDLSCMWEVAWECRACRGGGAIDESGQR